MKTPSKVGLLVVLLGLAALLCGLGLRWWRADRQVRPAEPTRGASPLRPERSERRAPIALVSARAVTDSSASSGLLEGRVVSGWTGQPVARARLSFLHAGAAFEAEARADGAFRFAPSEPGAYELQSLTADGYLPFAPELGHSPVVFQSRPGVRVTGLVLVLEPALEYTALVVDRSAQPIAGAEIRAIEGGLLVESTARSDAKGEARLHAASWSTLEARHPSHAPSRVVVTPLAQQTRRLRFVLGPGSSPPPSGVLAGAVVDTTEAGVADALVTIGKRGDEPGSARLLTGADGRYRFDALEPGHYRVRAEARGLAPAELTDVATGTLDATLRLSRGALLRGQVQDGKGRPLAAFTILIARRLAAVERQLERPRTFFDPEGRYAIEDLGPGSYSVSAAARSLAPAAEQTVTLDGPGSQAVADFRLGEGGRVRGRVVDKGSGRPLRGARVETEGGIELGGGALGLGQSTLTDGEGAFELGGLRAGLHSITAGAEGHHGSLTSGIRIEEGGVAGPIVIALRPVATGEEPQMEMVGIGAQVGGKGDAIEIRAVMPGGGAAEAGLGAGDLVLAVDGVTLAEIGSLAEAVERLRGPEGTSVVLLVQRAAGGSPAPVTVRRLRINF